MRKKNDIFEFVQRVHFEFINPLKKTVPIICSFLMTHVQKFASLRTFWTLLPLADIADLVLYTLNTTNSTKVNQEGMLSCKTHTLFFSSHLEMSIKLLHYVYSWDLHQFSLTDIGMQRLYILVICWLICLREQTIA